MNDQAVKYYHDETVHNLKAPGIIVPFLIEQFKPTSVLDVGCGIGTFLNIFQKYGVNDIVGIDGAWVDLSKLYIAKDKFHVADLESSFNFERKFDLILCLEVAEHLDEKSATQFVKSLIQHGDIIIFSAALPGQGGDNHLNENSFSYWQKEFEQYEYFFVDFFRERFWNNKNIDWWYRQNMFLVLNRTKADSLGITIGEKYFYDCFHPECLQNHIAGKNELQAYTELYYKIISGKMSLYFYLKQIGKKIFKRSK